MNLSTFKKPTILTIFSALLSFVVYGQNPVFNLTSGNANPTVCSGTAITSIVFDIDNLASNANPDPSVTFTPANGTGLTGTWSENNDTFTISGTPTGTISYDILATNNNGTTHQTGTITVTPSPTVADITGPTQVCVNATINLASTTPGGTWSSSNNALATVNSSGTVTGVSAGSVTISYALTVDGCTTTKTKQVTVVALPVVSMITGDLSVCVDETTDLNNGTAGGTWTTESGLIATVNSSGIVTGESPGTTEITYTVTVNQCSNSDSVDITVNANPVLSPITGTTTLCIGEGEQLSNSTPNGVWSTDGVAPVNATVNNAGQVFGAAAGSETIYYTFTDGNGCVDEVQVTVNVTSNASLALAPGSGSASQTICLGDPISNIVFNASNFTSAPIMESISGVTGTWNSSNSTFTISGTPDEPTGGTPVCYDVTLAGIGDCPDFQTQVCIAVKPVPVIASYIDDTYPCSGTTHIESPSNIPPNIIPVPTVYSWASPTVNPASITGGQAGNLQSNISFNLTHHGGAVGQAIFVVTPQSNGCDGEPFNYTVNINPEPHLDNPLLIPPFCSGLSLNYTPINGPDGLFPTGTLYDWDLALACGTTVQPLGSTTALLSNGPVNYSGNSPCTQNITVTPFGPVSMGSCQGDNFNMQVTINPRPQIDDYAFIGCNGNEFTVDEDSLTGMTIPEETYFSWEAPVWQNASACQGTNGDCGSAQVDPLDSFNEYLAHNTTQEQAVNIAITPYSSPGMGSCAGNEFDLNFTIIPGPSITTVIDSLEFCENVNEVIPTFTATGNPVWSWVCTGDVGFGTSGSGNFIPPFIVENPNGANNLTQVALTVMATAVLNNVECQSSREVDITVYPEPVINPLTNIEICAGIIVPEFNFEGTPVNEITFDYQLQNSPDPFGLSPTSDTGVLALPSFMASNNGSGDIEAQIIVTPTANICVGDPESLTITIHPAPSPPLITDFLPDGPVCGNTYGQAFAAQATFAGASFNWTASGNMTVIAGANNDVCIVNFNDPGQAVLTITASQGGCGSSSSVSFEVTEAPQPSLCSAIAVTPDGNGLVCLNNNVDSYQWGSIVVSAGDNWLESTLDQSGNGNDQFYYGQLLQDTVGKRIFVRICQDGCCTTTFYPDGCVEVPDLNVFTLSGSNAAFKVFPNPASEFLNITAPDEISGQTTMSLFDIAGNLIEQQFGYMAPSSTWRFDLSGFGNGMYFLRIKSNDGKDTTVKVIKN